MQLMELDKDTPLAVQSAYQAAELFYSEWADFAQGRKYYDMCEGQLGLDVLSAEQQEHVRRRMERLRTHEAGNWKALRLLHQTARGGWPEAREALHELTTIAEAANLLPEAARTIVERMHSEPITPAETVAFYKLLDMRARAEGQGEVRAWLELALGDMQAGQSMTGQGAMGHYQRAMEAAPGTGAAERAKEKYDRLLQRRLLGVAP